ncbi:MAG: phosphatase PAP2 family protein [Blautia sp.]|nr:phosphatase PAP2 family protein [Blautia sp.]MDY4516612.1 phosphatase PAP2 family protein [Lachnospiraceae bacterium]
MKWIKQYRHFLIVPVYFIFYMLIFGYVEKRSGVHIYILHSRLDDFIPFCEYFIVPYFLWFFYVAGAVVYFGLRKNHLIEYYRLIMTLGIGMTLFLVVSLVFPNGHSLRPWHFEHENVFVDMVRFLYSIDTPTNVLPSIHVFNSIAVAIAVADCEACKKQIWVVRCSNVLAILIVCATVFLKQHTVIDVVTALILNAACYYLIYRPRYVFGRKPLPETH